MLSTKALLLTTVAMTAALLARPELALSAPPVGPVQHNELSSPCYPLNYVNGAFTCGPELGLDSIGSTQGDLLYRGPSGWVVLAPVSPGSELFSGGSGGNVQWNRPERVLGGIAFGSTTPAQTGYWIVNPSTAPTSEVLDYVVVTFSGSGSPAATLAVIANGTTLTGCGSVTAPGTTACAGASTLAAGSSITLDLVSITGTVEPYTAAVYGHVVTP